MESHRGKPKSIETILEEGVLKMNSYEIYQHVTNTIIALLEDHKQNWDKPWISLGQDNDYARNPTTQKYYRGINQFLLGFEMMNKGYLSNQWATFKQIKDMDGHVIKGEKSTPVIFYKTAFIGEDKKYYKPDVVKTMSLNEYRENGINNIPVLKLYRVFNIASQTEGLDEAFYTIEALEEMQEFEKDESAENLIRETGAKIIEREGNRAYYDRSEDHIVLPNRKQFKGEREPFYGTALHELGHWTGHKSRLNREFGESFGDDKYAKEELVAELTSAFCSAHLGFTKTISNNVSYLDNWLSILKSDSKAIVSASAQAQKASDYIIGGAECAEYNNKKMEVG